jgi:hypothetical protein
VRYNQKQATDDQINKDDTGGAAEQENAIAVASTLQGLVHIPKPLKNFSNSQLRDWYRADPYQKEMDIISGAGAYFQVAYKRIIDVIPMCIENEFLVGLGVALRDALERKLGLVATSHDKIEANCEKYVAENGAIKEKRRKLEETKRILTDALNIIELAE